MGKDHPGRATEYIQDAKLVQGGKGRSSVMGTWGEGWHEMAVERKWVQVIRG